MGDTDLCENWEEFSEDSEKLEKELRKLKMAPNTSKIGINNSKLNPAAASFQSSANVASAPSSTPQVRILRRSQDPGTVGIPANANFNSSGIQLDSSSEDSLRTQFVPQLKILSRPKNSANLNAVAAPAPKEKRQVAAMKTFEQREKEYSEARMRILGDVRFLEEERQAELEAMMTPAEILKMKVAKAVMGDALPIPTPNSTATTSRAGPVNDIGINSDTLLSQSPPEEQGGFGTGGESGPQPSKSTKNKRKPRQRTTSASSIVPAPVHFPPSKIDSERILRQPRGPDGTSGFHFPR